MHSGREGNALNAGLAGEAASCLDKLSSTCDKTYLKQIHKELGKIKLSLGHNDNQRIIDDYMRRIEPSGTRDGFADIFQ